MSNLFNNFFHLERFFFIIQLVFTCFFCSNNAKAQFYSQEHYFYYTPFISDAEIDYRQLIKQAQIHSLKTASTHHDNIDHSRERPMPDGNETDSIVIENIYSPKGELLSASTKCYNNNHLNSYTSQTKGVVYQYDSLGRRISCYGKCYDEYCPDSTLLYQVNFIDKNKSIVEWKKNRCLKWPPLFNTGNQFNSKWVMFYDDSNHLTKIIRKDSSDLVHELFQDSDIFIYSSSGSLLCSIISYSNPSIYNSQWIDSTVYNYSSAGLLQSKTIFKPARNIISPDSATNWLDKDSIIFLYNGAHLLIGQKLYHNQESVKYLDFTKNETNSLFHSSSDCKNIYDKEGKLISSKCYIYFDSKGMNYGSILKIKKKMKKQKGFSFSTEYYYYSYY